MIHFLRGSLGQETDKVFASEDPIGPFRPLQVVGMRSYGVLGFKSGWMKTTPKRFCMNPATVLQKRGNEIAETWQRGGGLKPLAIKGQVHN
jgi:hypothetical protein